MKSTIPLRVKNPLLLLGATLAVTSAEAQPDYGPAIWNPPGCVKWYTSGYGHHFCVIHDMEGYYLSSVSYLNTCGVSASVYYAVNGKQDTSSDAPAGQITQMCREFNYAWHVSCWNQWMFGTEHEGFASNPAWYTSAMYSSSAGLQKHLTSAGGMPIDRNHVVAHGEWQNGNWVNWVHANYPSINTGCNSHTDPGPYWDWSTFMNLISGGGWVHPRIDSYIGNDGNGEMQMYLPGADNVMETDWQNGPGSGWVGWSDFGPVAAVGMPVVGYNADGRMQVFVRGTDNNIWSNWKTSLNGAWSGWNNYGGPVAGNVTVGYVENGAMQIFARSPNNTVVSMYQTGPNAGWSALGDMGGSCYADPTVGPNADGRMQVFIQASDHTVQSNWKTTTDPGASWSGWSDMGGSCYGKPAVGQLEDGRMYVFIRTANNTVQGDWQTSPNGGWQWASGNWGDMGGSCYADPVMAYNADGRIQLYTRSATNSVWSNWKVTTDPNGSWNGWADYGGSCYSDLAIGFNFNGVQQIFMRDNNNNVQSAYQTSPNGGWTGFGSMWGWYTPTITTQPSSQTVNPGANVTFTVAASHALTYQWQKAGANISGATSASYTINNVQASNAGNYACVVGNNAGTVTSSTATLTVNAPTAPTITTQPANQTVNQGASATFSVVASGTAPLSYQWKFGGNNISGATGSSYTIANAQPANAGVYAVTITNSIGSVTSSNATLTVNVPPSITTQPASQTVTQGANVTFSVVASGTAPLSYQWTFGGVNISGATSSSYSKNNVQGSDAGNYAVVVSNVAGNATSANAVLTVNVPPTITTQPASQTVAQGANVTFSVTASGTAPLSYQWTFNGANISGATSSTYTVNNAQASDQGNYNVVVTNPYGTATSATATLAVKITVILDNNASGFTASANWSTGTSSTDKYGADYRFRGTAATSDPATWTVNLANTGSYTIYAWWPQGSNRSTNAPYIVTWGTNTTTVKVNQQINGNTWNSLGTYNLNAGNNTVQLSCWTTTGFVVMADAIKWVQQ